MKKPTVFISSASEDAAIANVIEKGLVDKLNPNLEGGIEVIRDVYSFKTGSTLKDTIIEQLELADFLFVIYTDRLKKSHSYTGYEIGAFRVLMHQDIKKA